ncbi:MAG: hypothetical protein HND43_04345 [Armatimonadetes bacterium]|uniref:YbbR family protein n=1 Tax=Candidatus Nitrosymbiomonas proteolyticus TaxID=2608984 RepID=A0A809REB2_9BACT|nr:hypothetical protein [Armatimonadota bacterium]MCK6631158.1 hypothetical protein [Fimbriimonadaceae bacterium]QOJ11613.1 MAG: hypothetical protein HRU74_05915 [Chthonomonadaceae bacterium]BBO22745.1 conserved hypothetical protein [Candidatus Nitrosymbiomonas proteolyticus]MCL4284597.1 hypothetical protein [Fimbriimonadaceae bacterium]
MLILTSIVLGLSLWLYVRSLESTKVPITVAAQLYVSGKSADIDVAEIPTTVSATLYVPLEDRDKIDPKSIKVRAVVDLSGAEEGIAEYPVSLEVPSELRKYKWEVENRIVVAIEQVAQESKMVAVVESGEAPTGLELGAVTVQPESVTISGPKSVVSKVDTVRVLLLLSNVETGKTYTLPVEVFDENGKPITGIRVVPDAVSVSPALSPMQPRRTLLVSPKWTGQPAPGFVVAALEVNPNEVTVQGERKRLSDMRTIETEPVDLTGLKENTVRSVRLKLPAGVSVMGRDRIEIRIKIDPIPVAEPPPPGDG